MYAAFGDLESLDSREVYLLRMLKICEKFGWTLEYVKSMSLSEFNMIEQITAGETKARNFISKNPKAFGLGD